MVQALRDSARWDEAINLASDAITQLAGGGGDWLGMAGAPESEIAYVHVRRGRHGPAWASWERADRIARELLQGYRHVQTSFGRPVTAAHAVTPGVELRRPGEALRAADQIAPESIPSRPRRARHLIEIARAYDQRGEAAAVWAMLSASERAASETIKYNGYARDILISLRDRPPTGMREEVRSLWPRVGLSS